MNIRGITKFSLVDYPGKISCIVYVGNCNFRCPYCQNPYLVLHYETQPKIPEREIYDFLESRKGKLDGVVLSGGEPAMYPKIANFAENIKNMGFLFKLDTNASFPDRVIEMCKQNLIDMLGIDYKTTDATYNDIALSKINNLSQKVRKLIKYTVKNSIPCDIRTTVHKKFHSEAVLTEMRSELDAMGVKKWTLQQFNHTEIIDESLLQEETYSDLELIEIAKKLGANTHLRGLT
jgi:pyruvate formate lyase activating enzyme